MATSRVNFHKVYDLTERVIPEGVGTTPPTPEEYARFLITRYLRANGLGPPSEIAYLLKNTKPLVVVAVKELESFMLFNRCNHLRLHRITPKSPGDALRSAINDLAN